MNQDKNDIEKVLSEIKQSGTNKNLFDHFTALYETREVFNDDRKFLDIIEDVSLKIKEKGHYLTEVDSAGIRQYYVEQFNKHASKRLKLAGKLMKEAEEETEEPQEPEEFGPVDFVPDYLQVFRQLEWAGISFGDKESYLLTNSMRNLCAEKNLTSGLTLRFWGKIFGKQNDYYIVETDAEAEEGDEERADKEPAGSGVNAKRYFVTSSLVEGNWTVLPHVDNRLLAQSRHINYLFSGDLEKKIVTNPHFAGREKDLLRCQIARITFSCQLLPAGILKQLEEERGVEPEETPKPLKAENMLNLANWVHQHPNILKEGRLVHFEGNIDPELEAEQQEEEKKKILQRDPFAPLLSPANQDAKLSSSIPCFEIAPWKVGLYYDDKTYTNKEIQVQIDDDNNVTRDNKFNYSLITVQSKRWNGAFNYFTEGEYNFMYIGWGSKFSEPKREKRFVFNEFPLIQEDQQEGLLVPEPHEIPEEEKEEEEGMDEQ